MYGLGSELVDMYVGNSGVVVRTLGPQSREPGFESSCCRFEALAICSHHVATVHSVVQMIIWLQTEVDM